VSARGSDLVLVARRRERLETLAEELGATHGITAMVIPLDLSVPRAGQRLAQEVAEHGLTVTSLINCAGFATFGPFHAEDVGLRHDEISVDLTSGREGPPLIRVMYLISWAVDGSRCLARIIIRSMAACGS
jgi:uncharacterized protein